MNKVGSSACALLSRRTKLSAKLALGGDAAAAPAPPLARGAGSGTGARPETARIEPVTH